MRVLVLLLFAFLCGCSELFIGNSSSGSGVRLSDLRGEDATIKKYRVRMSKKVLAKALESGSVEDIRLVRMQRSTQSLARVEIPEYRIFSLQDKGPYRTLGLKNGDVLVAVEDYVVFEPWRFKRYVQMLPSQQRAKIEIRRYGRPVMLEYDFLE